MADINTDQNFPNVTLSITDSRGRAAVVDGVPVWASSDETVVTVSPSADGMVAVVDTVGAGVARISVTADADLGAGVEQIIGTSEDINVVLGPGHKATNISLSLGTPADKP